VILRVLLWLYLVGMALVCLLDLSISFSTDPAYVAALNLYVNAILLVSVWLYIKGKSVGFWRNLLVVALLIQAAILYQGYLVAGSPVASALDWIFLAILIIPPAYMGWWVGRESVRTV